MGFSVSVCHPEAAQSQAQPTALHCSGVVGVVALQGAAGIRSFSGRQRQEHGTLHPPLGCSQLLGSSSTTSKEFLLLPPACPVAWIWGVRHTALSLALWESQAERSTGNKQSMRRHMGLSFFTAYQGLELCRKPSDISQA